MVALDAIPTAAFKLGGDFQDFLAGSLQDRCDLF